jgi:hypothetical protein
MDPKTEHCNRRIIDDSPNVKAIFRKSCFIADELTLIEL